MQSWWQKRSKLHSELLRNRAAILVLLWSFSGLYVFQKLLSVSASIGSNQYKGTFKSVWFITGTSVAFYPFFGWLADARFGRYKVIKFSLLGMWLFSFLFCLAFMIIIILEEAEILTNGTHVHEGVSVTLEIALTIALSGCQANIIQFGIDQLADAPSYTITSFIQWYGWIWFFMRFLAKLSHYCFCHHYEEVDKLIIPGMLTVSLCLDFFCSGWLIHEPVSKNSLRLIYKVLKYAWLNKYPSKRSNFFLWDRNRCSRIDVAKNMFGGPFTTSEVEDVKTFWRILLVLVIGSIYGSMVIFINRDAEKMSFHFSKDCPVDYGCTKECLRQLTVNEFGSTFITGFIPALEVIFFFCRIKVNEVSLFKKAFIAMLLVSFSMILYGILEASGHYLNSNSIYDNSTCVLDLSTCQLETQLTINSWWLFLPQTVYSLGEYLILVVTIEFLCAQAPYSMKGLLLGLLWGVVGISSIINIAWLIPVQKLSKRWASGTRTGCGTIYFFTIASVLLVASFCFYATSKCYKKRERNEVQNGFPTDYT